MFRKITFLLCLPLILLVSCSKEEGIGILEGTYTGIFIRSSPNARYAPAEVVLTFSEGQFEGESRTKNHPAICKGTYTVESNTANFYNFCFFTADFDWSLVLAGEYRISASGRQLIIERTVGDTPIATV